MKKYLKTLMIACLVVPVMVVAVACGGHALEGKYGFHSYEIYGVSFDAGDFVIEEKEGAYEGLGEVGGGKYKVATEMKQSGKNKVKNLVDNKLPADMKAELGENPEEAVTSQIIIMISLFVNFNAELKDGKISGQMIGEGSESISYTQNGSKVAFVTDAGTEDEEVVELHWDKKKGTLTTTFEDGGDVPQKLVFKRK